MSQDKPVSSDQSPHENGGGGSVLGSATSCDRGKRSVVSLTGGDRDNLNDSGAKATPESDQSPPYNSIRHKVSAYSIEYDPYLRRNVEQPISYLAALVHMFKGSLGTGIMAVPNAFMHSGYIMGVIGTLFVGVMCTYSMHMLVRARYELSKRRREPSLTYQETAVAALEDGPPFLRPMASYAGHIVNVFMLVFQLGSCCVYVVFISSNIKAVVDEYYSGLDLRIYMLILLLPLILINMVRNLKLLAPFTTLASLLTIAGFGITFYYLVIDSPTLDDKAPFGTLEEFPLFLGTVLFSLEAIGVILPLEDSMKTPKRFREPLGVLNIAMVLVVSLFTVTGFLGYMKYGDQTQGSITLSLPNKEKLAQSAKLMLAIAIFVSHSLQNYVNIEIVWNGYLLEKLEKHPYKMLFEYLVRIFLVTISFVLAVAVPNLELFISLFGALCLSAIGIAFPAIIYCLCVWNNETTRFKFVLLILRTGFIVLFAVVGFAVGTYTSLSNIVIEFS
ncbi:proton-coupled amino acid transporter-like protein CG1139 [Schistocerca gregaria]|uniref:proton-coupled amino acid transporter-like protein CG1139 n=1 Tax=Schistocerca gregaria TaxID=7010 RepID=UPI00211DB40A|nr:proton-coupled amino acid transporter-like protein CG1139 [Schistocerca gregaria]XP_049829769.1 proton-coupled amino acid transporter-like protein CG1139 [Schistocerca gregaria]